MDGIFALDPLKVFSQIVEDCPKQLFALGNTSILDELNNFEKAAIIGARNADNEGLGVAYDLGKQLNSTIVISGLAKGIDTAAHVGCLYRRGSLSYLRFVPTSLSEVHIGCRSSHPFRRISQYKVGFFCNYTLHDRDKIGVGIAFKQRQSNCPILRVKYFVLQLLNIGIANEVKSRGNLSQFI